MLIIRRLEDKNNSELEEHLEYKKFVCKVLNGSTNGVIYDEEISTNTEEIATHTEEILTNDKKKMTNDKKKLTFDHISDNIYINNKVKAHEYIFSGKCEASSTCNVTRNGFRYNKHNKKNK